MKKGLYIWLLLALVACQSKPLQQQGSGNHYATGFSIQQKPDYTCIEVYDPWSGGIMQRYYLIRDTLKEKAETHNLIPDDGLCVSIPIKRIATTSCTHIGFLAALNSLDILCGVCNPELIYTDIPETSNLGDAMQINIERVLLAKPDALMLSTYAQGDNQRVILEQAGIPILFNNEWTESHPLARAEWIRFVGAFLDKQAEADSLFAQVENDYQALVALKDNHANDPQRTILSGGNFRGTWYLPSGEGYMGNLFKDAGANYYYQNNTTNGSLPLTMENVLLHFQNADVWVGASTRTLLELKELDEKHTWFNAYQTGEVYNYLNQTRESSNAFWEEGVVHPEYILSDLIYVLYPDRLTCYKTHYINKLE